MDSKPQPSASSDPDPFMAVASANPDPAARSEAKSRRLPQPLARLASFLRGKQTVLWWLHSTWALLFGLGVMWLGSKNFIYLRIIVFHIGFIWLSSLFLPVLLDRPRFSPLWRERVRLLINYFNKNFYQQLLFFLLPIYYASTTLGSRNMVFLILLSISAVLSTLDVFYDRYLSVRWHLTALFFAFNLFASINVILPVLWSVSHRWALWISAILALIGFDSMLRQLSGLHGRSAKLLRGGAAVVLLATITVFTPYIPPAPLALASAQFGRSIRSLQIVDPLAALPASPGKIFFMAAIKAPLGLQESVRHRWYIGGRLLWASKNYSFAGSQDGYRVWTQINWSPDFQGSVLTVDVETDSGQLIGRARLSR